MSQQIITDAIAMSERIKEELEQLDEMIQVYQKVEDAVRANPQIQRNNLFFGVFQWCHSDSLLIRLRRLVDKDKRSGSLRLLCKFISDHATAFDKGWYARIYAGTVVEPYAQGWWLEVATPDGAHLCPMKLMAKADELHQATEKCSNWISQNIAHLDRNATVPPPLWGECYAVLDGIKALFRQVHRTLTGHDCDCRVAINFPWEHCLMVPWMKPTKGFLAQTRTKEDGG